ncbi:MAG: hypothetical protein IPK17_22335 [Chloroflexi bacterium]|uniref:hypothetical protein n=1 Tax=Candidatus Flexifilum breve TaxID=3140694 RepID=UPI00313497DB|nr:hypothetical protein [Chloroflexota bacterium]
MLLDVTPTIHAVGLELLLIWRRPEARPFQTHRRYRAVSRDYWLAVSTSATGSESRSTDPSAGRPLAIIV